MIGPLSEPFYIFYTGLDDMYGNPLVLECEVVYRPDRRLHGSVEMIDGMLYVLLAAPDQTIFAVELEDIHLQLERIYNESYLF